MKISVQATKTWKPAKGLIESVLCSQHSRRKNTCEGLWWWWKNLRMVATNVKAETMSLMDKRSALEAEMNSIIARLSHPGGPGLSGNLVDSEVLLFTSYHILLLISTIYMFIFFLHKYSLTHDEKVLFFWFFFPRASLVRILTFLLFEPSDVVLQVLNFFFTRIIIIIIIGNSRMREKGVMTEIFDLNIEATCWRVGTFLSLCRAA